jgi:hypothetical protein
MQMGFWWEKLKKDQERTSAWMEDVKMALPNTDWHSVYLIHMTQDREKWHTPTNMLMGPSVA